MAVKALIFDMDGTILHTLPDLVVAANEALVKLGYPPRTEAEALACMGDGSRHLVEELMPAGCTTQECARTFELWRNIYIASDYALTAPFPGMVDALGKLRLHGVKTAILSNKFDAGVRSLEKRFFDGLFDLARGEIPPVPRKPDPTSLLQMLEDLRVNPSEAAYVGDTNVDVLTARNAGVKAVGVAWGYDTALPLVPDELDAYIHDPSELVEFVLG